MTVGEIIITVPGPGRCRLCATAHRPEEPHERKSLYYQVQFYQKHRRFPTGEDAARHCSAAQTTAEEDSHRG